LAGWVFIATRLGWPVSTTHALLGGVVGAVWTVAGFAGLEMDAVSKKALLPPCSTGSWLDAGLL